MMKFETVYFPVLKSTNQYMSDLLSAGQEIDGLCVRAGFQEAGKGQAENSWHSEKDKNLLISLGFDFSFLQAAKQFFITQLASVACLQVLRTFLPEAKLTVKWPNDLFVGDKKIGGMLISNTIDGQNLQRTIIGLGINLNQTCFPETIGNPVSVMQLTGKQLDVGIFQQKLLDSFAAHLVCLKTEEGQKVLEKNYLGQLYAFDEFRLYDVNGQKKRLKITGIGEFGYLLTADEQGKTWQFDMKEIGFLF